MKAKILNFLSSSNEYISGEELSEKCGVSRTAIWKHMNNLKIEGYEIDSQARKGYKLLKRPDALIKSEILAELGTLKWGKEYLFTYDEIDSTNLVAKKLANEGKPEGTVVVAEHQWAGKGRLGREWDSPKGTGVWVSIILKPNISPVNAAQLSFVMAVGMVKALKRVTDLDVKTKWPNDILINRRKVVGILTEMSAEIEKINYIVVGIGVNVNQENNDFPEEFRERCISLKIAQENKKNISRVKVLKAMLEEIEITYNEYLEKGFKPILEQWKNASITIGQNVEVVIGPERISGLAIEVEEDGSLLVKKANGEIERVIAGDVSLRSSSGDYA